MPLEDLPLRSGSPAPPRYEPPPPPAPSPWRWVAVGLVALAAGAGLTYWWMTRAQPTGPLPAPTVATDGAGTLNRPQRQPMELPEVDGSDSLLRELVSVLSKHPLLARLLATDGLVRRVVLAVDQMADGRTPAVPLAVLRPPTRLAIAGTDSGPIDPRSYQRWDSATAALVSINPREAAQLYVNVKPLFDAAWADLGHPGGDFDTAITRAIDVALATPSPETDPVLLRRPGFYEHTDPALRSLRPVQKQLLLVGPQSRAQLFDWMRRLATALDLPVTQARQP